MKITRFTIKSLHGFFDYDIKLNEDITFLFGENGSGKTTVLSMLDHVVSGEVYKLFEYQFKSITVFFTELDSEHGLSLERRVEVHLIQPEGRRRKLQVKFKGESETVKLEPFRSHDFDSMGDSYELNKQFFRRYKLPQKIRQSFNYLFLPLHRLNFQIGTLNLDDFRMIRNRIAHSSEFVLNSSENMNGVEGLVRKSVMKINRDINELNARIRQDILKSALEMSQDVNYDDFFKYFEKDDLISELDDTKERYIKLLDEFEMISDEHKKAYDSHFDKLISEVKEILVSREEKPKRTLPAKLIATYGELKRIRKLVDIYEAYEKKTLDLKTPLNDFLYYTNIFLKNGKDEKELEVDSLGRVFFTTNYTKDHVELKHLSSGEKQIVTLISNLIFKVDRSKFTIFIIDEPELSLHLSWQKKIVETIHEINKNMQLVFATHSPEIIGKYSSKAFELEKHYKPIEKSIEKTTYEDDLDDLDDLDDFINDLESNL